MPCSLTSWCTSAGILLHASASRAPSRTLPRRWLMNRHGHRSGHSRIWAGWSCWWIERKKWRQRLENSRSWKPKTQRKGALDYSEHGCKNLWSRRTCIMSRSSAEVIPQETSDVWGHGPWGIGVFATISEISTQLCLGSVRCQMAGPVTALRWEPVWTQNGLANGLYKISMLVTTHNLGDRKSVV